VSPTIRLARPSDLRHLAAIEDAGAVLFDEHFGVRLRVLSAPAPSGGERDLTGTLLVALVDEQVVGFAHLVTHDGNAHLEQVSVLPTYGRRGIGTALVRAAMEEARWSGHDRMSLCTFREVPFNGPFYAALGFTESTSLEPFQARLRAVERALGLDEVGARIVMSARLGRR
jgi:GNAT superfamily N-acetyltransferase